MASATKKPSRWGNLPDRTKVERRERRYGILSNIVTLLLTCAIIVGGFMLPTFLSPYLDLYQAEVVQLSEPSPGTRVFKDPVVLYPWNLYDEAQLQTLSPARREFLEVRGIPEWLLAVMQDCGMETTEEDSYYYSLIINSFYYLEPSDSNESGCYFLVDLDLNGDNSPDFSCAVDSFGNFVSFRFSSNAWDSAALQAPIGMPLPTTEENAADKTPVTIDQNTGDNTLQGATTGTGQSTTTGLEAAAGQGTTAVQGTTTAPVTDPSGTANGNTTVADDPNDKTDVLQTNPALEHPPSPDDLNIWSFAYVISREAQLINQKTLFRTFRQIEFVFETRYSYPFTMLLPIQSPEEENLPEIEYIPLELQTLRSDQYLLHIYYLPSGETLVLYLQPTTLKCMGFSLLL